MMAHPEGYCWDVLGFTWSEPFTKVQWDKVDDYAGTATQPAMVVGSGMESPSSRIDSN